MIQGDQCPGKSNAQAGAGSLRLLVLIASTVVGLTLMASSANTGNKHNGTEPKPSCGYGPIQVVTNASGAIVGCQREVRQHQKCASCTSTDYSNGVDCSCQTGCVGGGGFQPGWLATGTCNKSITNCVSGTLSAPWKFLHIGAGGKRCYVMTEVVNYTNQCVFPNATPCDY